MTLEEMRIEVVNIVQDASFDDAIDGYINEAFLQAAGELNIPDLKRVGMFTTVVGASVVNLAGVADDFNGRFSKLLDDTVEICNTLEHMLDRIAEDGETYGATGAVTKVALEGKNVWYNPIPAAPQSLLAVIFGNPPKLENDDDVPLCFIPESHRQIGVHGAAAIIYDQIEDGIEGEKINTIAHRKQSADGVRKMRAWIAKNRKHNITSQWSV